MNQSLAERLEVMALGETSLYGEAEELVCACKGRGHFMKRKIPRLPWKAMMARMAISDEDSDTKRGRGRARMLRDHCTRGNRKPGSRSTMVTEATIDKKVVQSSINQEHLSKIPQVSRVQPEFPTLAESTSETSTSHGDFKKPMGVVRKGKTKFRKFRMEDLNMSSRSSDLDYEPAGTQSDRSEQSGMDTGDVFNHSSSKSSDIEKPVKPKLFKESFDLAKANQDLLNKFYSYYHQPQKVMPLTTRNLEKFTRESDKDIFKSGGENNQSVNLQTTQNESSGIQMYEKYAVTLDDIRLSRMKHKDYNIDVLHTNNLDPLAQAMDVYLSQSNDHLVSDIDQEYKHPASGEINTSLTLGYKDNEVIEAAAATAAAVENVEQEECASDVSNLSNFTNPDLSSPQFSDEICVSDKDMEDQPISEQPENQASEYQCFNQDRHFTSFEKQGHQQQFHTHGHNIAVPSLSDKAIFHNQIEINNEGLEINNEELNSSASNRAKGVAISNSETFSTCASELPQDNHCLDRLDLSCQESMNTSEDKPANRLHTTETSQDSSVNVCMANNEDGAVVAGINETATDIKSQNTDPGTLYTKDTSRIDPSILKSERHVNCMNTNGVGSDMETDLTSDDPKSDQVKPVHESVIYQGVVVVDGTDIESSDEKGFKKVVTKNAKKKTPPPKSRAYVGNPISKQHTDHMVWRLYGKEVIQVDGLPRNVDLDHLLSMVNAFGMVKDYQVRQDGEGHSSVRFRLESVDACEFACQCLHDSECVLPESNGRITCLLLT